MRNYYVGWSLDRLKQRLNDLQTNLPLTAQTVAQTNGGTRNEFKGDVGLEIQIERVEYAIAMCAECVDSDDPICVACKKNQRPGRTLPTFC